MSSTTTTTTSKTHNAETCPVCKTRAFIERFVAFNHPEHSLALALWVLHTHVFEGAYTTPYMYVTSTEPGCGKTTVLEACHELARSPLMAAGVSASSLFRTIEAGMPSLFIDEVDTVYSGSKNDDLRQVLNSGYKHSGNIMRTIDGEPRNLSTFAPKMLGGIDNDELPSTVRERCIEIKLSKVRKDKLNIERFLMRKVEAAAKELKEEIRAWATVEMAGKINNLDVAPLAKVSDRQADIAEPLMQIATVAGHAQEARAALTTIFHGTQEESREVQVLKTLRDMFEQTGADRVTNTMLADATGIPVDRLGRLMSKTFGLKPRPIKISGNVYRGYYAADAADAFERFID